MKKLIFGDSRGNALVETALILSPLIVLSFTIIELSRGLWAYHTLGSAVKQVVRYSVVRGEGCVQASASCAVTVGNAVQTLQQKGFGIDWQQMSLSLTAGGQTVTCDPVSSCVNNATQWPAPPNNAPGIRIVAQGRYKFQSMLSALWKNSTLTGGLPLLANASEVIQF